MKNYFIYFFKSKLKLNIKGNNIERFIKRLKNNNIDILELRKISNNEINIKIYKKDYEDIIKLKTIYEVDILNTYGLLKLKNNVLNNKIIIISIFIALIFLYILSNIIFHIDVVTNDSKMENILKEELKEYGIKKYSFKKNYKTIQNVKKKILSNHKNEIEWIEIESIGTKYIIKYEPRVINDIKENTSFRNIIASKDAVISDMFVSSGQILKNKGAYVKKGHVIVSGFISLNENIKDTISSDGKVYGEVWYKVTVTYPFKYYEEKFTGKSNNTLTFKFLNKNIEVLNFNKYEDKKIKDNILLKNNMLPIYLTYQNQREIEIINENLNEDEAIKKAILKAQEKIEKNLNDGEYIKNYKVLNKTITKEDITLNIFFSVIENITEYSKIEKYVEEDNN